MRRHALNRKATPALKPASALAASLLVVGLLTATDSVKASGPVELVGDLSSVCATTGTTARFIAWPNNSGNLVPWQPDDSKWGTASNYSTADIVRIGSGSAANLSNVPTGSKNPSAYISYPFTTGADTRVAITRLQYGDESSAVFNMQAKLFSVTGGTATAVAEGGESAETAEVINVSPGTAYGPVNIAFPHTLLKSNQAYELRAYIWTQSGSTVTGYDDFYIQFAPCLPAPPTPGSVTFTETSISVPFTAPSITGGSPISSYQYSLNNGSTWLPSSPPLTSSPLSLTGLTNGQTYDIILRTVTTAGVSAATSTISATTGTPPPPAPSSAVSEAPRQVVTLVSPKSNTSVPRSRVVSLFGTHFDTLTEVFVGGVKVEMRKKSALHIEIIIPRSISGVVDLELRSPLNNVLAPKHFNLGATGTGIAGGTELSVAGFGHNSRKLTPSMKLRIERWLAQNPNLSKLTCMGFTSLPKRSTDVALSTKRGTTVCNYAKRVKPELEAIVSPGVEDPRPGSKVRRALLILTS